MGNRIAGYKAFYEEDEPYEFTGPLKVDDVPLLKKMEMIHTLMGLWKIEPWDFVPYLQRFIFKGYKEFEGPDAEAYNAAIKTLKKIHDRIAQQEREGGHSKETTEE